MEPAAAATTAVTSAASNRENSTTKKQSRRGGSDSCMGIPLHSQVIKIKQEIEKIKYPSLQQLEIKHVFLRDFSRRHRSRSPLGLAKRAIPVGKA